jgi:hypothetical protein
MTSIQLRQKLRTILLLPCPTTYLVLLLGSIALIGSLILAIVITDQPGYVFTGDPAAITNQPFYLGAFSNIGILFWCAASTICFFASALLKDLPNKIQDRRFLFNSGLVTTLLLLDDLFLLHEDVLPRKFGIPEKMVYVAYAVIVAFYLLRFSKNIVQTNFIPLFLAFGLFAMSVLNDKTKFFIDYSQDLHSVAEDGSKLLGIFCWFIYFAVVSLEKLKAASFYQTEYRQYRQKALR